MIVILAEKPSQAKAYAEAFKVAKKTKHFITLAPDAIFPDGATITWGIGHLVELKAPAEYDSAWKRWKLDVLPMIPKKYEYKVAKGKWEQFQEVKKLLKQADLIINACDVDREGSNIFYSILRQAGIRHRRIERLWINSLERDEIRKGFQSLQSNEKDLRMFEEAETRQISDWLVGMNASRLYTVLLKQQGLNEVMSIGRVQSPTVYMIYERQREIENFQPKKFYEIIGQFQAQRGMYKGKAKVKKDTYEEALAILQRASIAEHTPMPGVIDKVTKKMKRNLPPKLHSLSTLQQKANRMWKFSPKMVLETVQKLYEKKLVSYPRSDCQYITPAEFQYLAENVTAYQQVMKTPFDANVQPSKRYVDASKVEEHYAIIPTKTVPTVERLAKLSDAEKRIYVEIMRTTLAMFHRDYVYEETTVETNVQDVLFYSVGKVEKDIGFRALWPRKKEDDEPTLPIVEQGETVEADIHVHEGETKPPKPFTEGQLIQMMKTCGKLVDDEAESDILKEVEGIGTEATRAGIIETIKKHEYITVTKNIVSLTPKGRVLCQVIEGSLLASPIMTAKWETYLRKIGEGTGTQQAFFQSVEKFLRHLIETTPQTIEKTDLSEAKAAAVPVASREPIVACPSCEGGQLIEHKSFYGCTNYKAGCKMTISKIVAQKKISPKQLTDLVTKGETAILKGFKSKKGNPFSAKLKLENGKVTFDFAE
ncbi:type IA DNA topoisomerase [Kurthia massiliensis]|uniref:type IA DNA topoisomerase n=1 Tax=Kurthia massiliensis TaxID=1033739 RepID=UPI000289D833|nr:type IA DNA topoisomerase [Kurthia massiliensis]